MKYLKTLLKSLLWIIWPTTSAMRERTAGVPKNMNPPPPPETNQAFIYINGVRISGEIRYVAHSDELKQPPYPVTVVGSIYDLLQQAVDAEDYEEAARLRDLIRNNETTS